MTERDALLHAVCENPEDDTPRLALADWLDEHGEDDRAEFIRLQIELATMPDGKRKEKLRTREEELLEAHREEWTAPLKEFEGNRTDDYYVFRRGFVEAVGSDGEIMVEEGDRLFALAPVREMVFADEEEYEELAKCKWLLRLHTLDMKGSGLSRYFDPRPLIRSKYLANLTTLILAGEDDNGHLDSLGMQALAATKHLVKLERLDLGHNWMFGPHHDPPEETKSRKALWKLGENKPALRELCLRDTGLRDGEVSGLAYQSWVSRLRVLDLSRNGIADDGCRSLCESKFLANLERLDLTRNAQYDEAAGTSTPLSPVAKRMLKKRFGKRVAL